MKDIEIRTNKEIANYSEVFFFGLTLRQTVFVALSGAVAIVIYFWLSSLDVSIDLIGIICLISAVPFAFLGFYEFNGMNASEYLKAIIKSEIVMPKKLGFVARNIYEELLRENSKDVKVKRDRPKIGKIKKAKALRAPKRRESLALRTAKEVTLSAPEPARETKALPKDDTPSLDARTFEATKKLKKAKATKQSKALKNAAAYLIDIMVWIILSLILTYIVNKTNLLNTLFK